MDSGKNKVLGKRNEAVFSRQEMLIGSDAQARLASSRVALFGVGGVGSYAAEALVRGGVGELMIVDHDRVSYSNINRQLCALHSTVGEKKVDVVGERLLDVNPELKLIKRDVFLTPDNIGSFGIEGFDYVIDAIDTVSAKIALIKAAKEAGVPIISSMGTGNKLDPSALLITDLSKTSGCPLARVMRRELKKLGITSLTVVASTELPITPDATVFERFEKYEKTDAKPSDSDAPARIPPASISFVPSVAGLLAAGEVIRSLMTDKG